MKPTCCEACAVGVYEASVVDGEQTRCTVWVCWSGSYCNQQQRLQLNLVCTTMTLHLYHHIRNTKMFNCDSLSVCTVRIIWSKTANQMFWDQLRVSFSEIIYHSSAAMSLSGILLKSSCHKSTKTNTSNMMQGSIQEEVKTEQYYTRQGKQLVRWARMARH